MWPKPRFLLSVVTVVSTLLGGCVFTTPESRAGISRREADALGDSYGWLRNLSPTDSAGYTDDFLASLFVKSNDPTLDGDRAESYSSELALALAVAGDDRFARALLRQPETIRRAVLSYVSRFWTQYRFHYPRTEALLK